MEKQCALCNEHVDDVELQFGDVIDLDGEYWHTECYAEYFGEMPPVEELEAV